MKFPFTRREVSEAFKAVFGFSESQAAEEKAQQNEFKIYTYDDLPSEEDGQVNPETGMKYLRRIPKRNITTKYKIGIVLGLALFVGASMTITLLNPNVRMIGSLYKEYPDGWHFKYFGGTTTQKELHIDYVRDLKGNKPDESRPIIVINKFSVPNTDYLETAYIGATVKSIGVWAFSNGKALKNIMVDPANQYFKDVDGVLFSKDGARLIQYPAGRHETEYVVPAGTKVIGDGAFYHFSKDKSEEHSPLKRIVLPEGLETIERMGLFGNINLAELTLPSTLKSFGADAFSYCEHLPDKIYIPASVKEIGDNAFYFCGSVKEFYLGSAEGELDLPRVWMPKIDQKPFKTIRSAVTFGVTPEQFAAIKEGN